MRFIFSKIFSVLFSKKKVYLGLDNAGKTIYYPKTNAVVFVIDSSDKERIDIAKQELFLLLQEDELKGVPIAILANKQDIDGVLSDIEISEKMGLSEIKNRQWAIFKTIAKTGKGLDDAFKWLTGILKEDNKV